MSPRFLANAVVACAFALGPPACAKAGPGPAPPAEPPHAGAPCWTPLGRRVVVADPVAERALPDHVLTAARSRWDPAELPLPALFVATPIVVQGRVARIGAPRAERDGTWFVDADVEVDAVVKNLSAVRVASREPLRVTVPLGHRRVAFKPEPVVIALGRRSVLLLKTGRHGVGYVSEALQAISVDRSGALQALPELASFPADEEIAAAHDLTGLCARMRSLSRAPIRTAGDLERALLRWAGITTARQQRVYDAQMRRNPDAVALYLFIAKSNLGRGKDRTFPSRLCATDRDRRLRAPRTPPCMSYAAMDERINPGHHYIYL